MQVTRGALGNLLGSMAQRLDIGPGELWLAVTSLSFDIAALELHLPLVSGGTVLLAGDGQSADAGALMRLLREHPVRTMQATPATWRLLLEAGWTGGDLRLLCGGEAMSAELADRLSERADTLWNVYGPTETTIWSTLQRVAPADRPFSPPIGLVLDNTDALVLDERLNPVPPGVAGELYLGGDGLARGYRGRPDLSAERFVPNPCRPGSRVYRTGDVVRRWPDGRLQCLGRSDRQIKLRGFRIELDEIESALSTTAGVKQAAVVAFGAEAACEIVAYAVPDEGMLPRITPLALREALTKRLPGYILPSHFVLLDALPLTPNAKVDRKALARPQGASNLARPVAPSTPAEALVANVWEELLGPPQSSTQCLSPRQRPWTCGRPA